MGSTLTGDYDVVIQVPAKTLDRLLAVMHQNDGSPGDLPTLPHRLVRHVEHTLYGIPVVHGTAWVQVAPPTVELLPHATSEAVAHCRIRARYRPDPGTVALPEFIHGSVRARFAIDVTTENGVPGFRARVTQNDSQIGFTSPELSATDVAKVLGPLRTTLHKVGEAFLPISGNLPGGLPQFVSVVEGAGQAVALPQALRGQPAAPGSLSRVFTDGKDVALAIGEEYLLSFFEPTLSAIMKLHDSVNVEKVGITWVTFDWEVTSADAALTPKGFAVTVKAHAHSDNVIPGVPNDIDITVTQALVLVLDPKSQTLSVLGEDPLITAKHYQSKIRAKLKPLIIAQRDAALAQAQPQIDKAFGQTQQLHALFQKIDPAASVRFDTLAIEETEGVVLRGTVKLSPAKAARVEFVPLTDDTGYTAFESWIPGGWIKTFHWLWAFVVKPNPTGLFGQPIPHQADISDRFVIQEPPDLPGVDGKLPAAGGGTPSSAASSSSASATSADTASVVATPGALDWISDMGTICLGIGVGGFVDGSGKACHLAGKGPSFPVPPKVFIKWPYPDAVGLDPVLAGNLLTLVEPVSPMERPGLGPANLLVQFVGDADALDVLAVLDDGIRQAGRADAGLVLALIGPEGGLRRPLAEGFRGFGRGLAHVRLLATEDVRKSWSRAFDLPESGGLGAATLLLTAPGQPAWRHDGLIDAATLAAGLRAHLVSGDLPLPRRTSPGVRAGQVAPEFTFPTHSGQPMALRHLRGRRVVVSFVEAGSRSSPAGVNALARTVPLPGPDAPVVLAIVRGAEPATLDALRRAHGQRITIVPDADGRITRRYGVHAWPTTVWIDWDGQVAGVQIGAEPAFARAEPISS